MAKRQAVKNLLLNIELMELAAKKRDEYVEQLQDKVEKLEGELALGAATVHTAERLCDDLRGAPFRERADTLLLLADAMTIMPSVQTALRKAADNLLLVDARMAGIGAGESAHMEDERFNRVIRGL